VRILAIDPGTTESGYVLMNSDGLAIIASGVVGNDKMLADIRRSQLTVDWTAMEWVQSYGMPVGKEVFETVFWTGRFIEACLPGRWDRVTRGDVKRHLCGSPRARDSNVRRALLDMYPHTGGGKTPAVGTKAQPGPLYGISTHCWAALGVGVTFIANRAST